MNPRPTSPGSGSPTGRVPSSEWGNNLLDRLPETVIQRLRPHLNRLSLGSNQLLYESQSPITQVYFPTSCVASALTVMADGRAIEVGSEGREGATGVTVLFGEPASLNRLIIQVPGDAFRIRADILQQEAREPGPLRELLLRYHAYFFVQVSQSVACNGLHPIQKRCCRWLLMTHDRTGQPELPLTHEFLAMMLGVRRAGVTEVLQSLQQLGLVRCGRGKITLLDRQGMEAQACECYGVVAAAYTRIVG